MRAHRKYQLEVLLRWTFNVMRVRMGFVRDDTRYLDVIFKSFNVVDIRCNDLHMRVFNIYKKS